MSTLPQSPFQSSPLTLVELTSHISSQGALIDILTQENARLNTQQNDMITKMNRLLDLIEEERKGRERERAKYERRIERMQQVYLEAKRVLIDVSFWVNPFARQEGRVHY